MDRCTLDKSYHKLYKSLDLNGLSYYTDNAFSVLQDCWWSTRGAITFTRRETGFTRIMTFCFAEKASNSAKFAIFSYPCKGNLQWGSIQGGSWDNYLLVRGSRLNSLGHKLIKEEGCYLRMNERILRTQRKSGVSTLGGSQLRQSLGDIPEQVKQLGSQPQSWKIKASSLWVLLSQVLAVVSTFPESHKRQWLGVGPLHILQLGSQSIKCRRIHWCAEKIKITLTLVMARIVIGSYSAIAIIRSSRAI